MIPLPRLWLTGCILALPTMVAGFFPSAFPLILLLDVLLVCAAAFDFFMARSRIVSAKRVLPTRFQVGVKARIELEVVNLKKQRAHLLVIDDFPDAFDGQREPIEFDISPQSRARIGYEISPKHRGRFAFGDVSIRSLGPLRLAASEQTIALAEDVNVFPDMRGASKLLLGDATLDLVNLGLRQLRRDGSGSEFARLRDYSQGDSVRDVDWKATARRGKPVTRVMESERSQTVLIGVDAGRSMAALVNGLTKLDHAVNAALFLAFVAIKNGDRVGLVVFADGVKTYLAPAAGRLQYRRIVDSLYSAQPSLTYVDYLALFKELNTRLVKRSLLCVFTDFIDEDQAQTMVLPFRRLSKRHIPLCLSVKDASLSSLLQNNPIDSESAHQHAVASELLLEREVMKRKIALGGATIIDVEASELALSAVNKYIDIKSRGAL
jgi:uncharacterized protein (DUF58 family)